MATIGQQLLQPEAGWRRYDDTNKNIAYRGQGWTHVANDSNWYDNTVTYVQNPSGDVSVCFNFYGSKLRLVQTTVTTLNNKVDVYIDGILSGSYTNYGSLVRHVLLFEKLNLPIREHSVELKINSTAVNKYLGFDAIDIDYMGKLLPYNPSRYLIKDKTSIKTIKDDELVTLSTATPIKQDFIENGVTDLKPLIELKTKKNKTMNYKSDLEDGKIYSINVNRAEISTIEKIQIL